MSKIISVHLLTLLSGLFFLDTAHAAGKMKPGLWEMSIKSDAMKAMPKMSPEQMEQMKKMGINMPMMEDGVMKTKVCISKEMAEQDPSTAMHQNHSNCTPKNVVQNGNEYSMDLICDGPELKGIGAVKGSFNGSDTVRSSYDFKGTSHNRPVNHHTETTGKLLSSDCGDVKPVGVFPKK
ncbi:MAG: DUF3617 domain-containing protein [Pseudomonadota bacterium]